MKKIIRVFLCSHEIYGIVKKTLKILNLFINHDHLKQKMQSHGRKMFSAINSTGDGNKKKLISLLLP